jgi:hypothetical protein
LTVLRLCGERKEDRVVSRRNRVLLFLIAGVVGGYSGYWIGHALGWSHEAEWPLGLGGGAGAMALSIGMVLVGVGVAALWIRYRPLRAARRLLERGKAARATIMREWTDGAEVKQLGEFGRPQLGLELLVHLPSGYDYRARTTKQVEPGDEVVLKPGAEVDVRYDPEHPDRVAVTAAARSLVG